MPTEFQIQEGLRRVVVPGLDRTLGEANMLKGAQVSGDAASVRVELPTPAFPGCDALTASIQSAAQRQWPELKTVNVTYSSVVKGKMTGGAIGLKVKNVIAVGSGKGGVGK